MQFGIGLVEFLLLSVVLLAVPAGIVFLLIRAVLRRREPSRTEDHPRQLAAELDAARLRLEELEGKLSRAEDQARFTESLLEGRGRH
jgi:hypothetical protein